MNWINANDALPEVATGSVLTYGYHAPDGPRRVRYEFFCGKSPFGAVYWSQSDVVEFWCPLDGVLTPEEAER